MNLYVCGLRLDTTCQLPECSSDRLSEAVVRLKKQVRCESALLLSTCDRVELWTVEGTRPSSEALCRALSLPPLAWKHRSYAKEGQTVLPYLFSLACGLHSSLFGEDQIVSQIGEALQRSRECGCTSALLEQLATSTVATARKVHASVDLQAPDPGVAEAVCNRLAERFGSLEGLSVLVIGSSAMARMVASRLLEGKACVTMTIRDMEKADLLLPVGVRRLSYDRRFDSLRFASAVISATKGMEYTVTASEAGQGQLYFDLASRPDIDPAVGMVGGNELFDIGSLGCGLPMRNLATEETKRIVSRAVDQFLAWVEARANGDTIRQVSEDAANDLVFRVNGPIARLDLPREQERMLKNTLADTARKAVSHQLYVRQKKVAKPMRVDLSRRLESALPVYPGDPAVEIEQCSSIETDGYRLKRLVMGSHSGTHMDSPAHLLGQGPTLDRYPVESFFASAFVLDCRNCPAIDLELVSTVPGSVGAVLFATGWEQRWATDAYLEDPPLLSEEAAMFLVGRGITIFGFDSPSCDRMDSHDLPIHSAILSAGALIVENLCNLLPLVGKCIDLVALPLSVRESDGCPARVVATFTP
jgi:glutamyl-tRNA reductase